MIYGVNAHYISEKFMKRTLMASLLALFPLTANAGWGFTSHTDNIYSAKTKVPSPMDNVPTVDFWSPKISLQFYGPAHQHGLENSLYRQAYIV